MHKALPGAVVSTQALQRQVRKASLSPFTTDEMGVWKSKDFMASE